jgi:hypothetical protein
MTMPNPQITFPAAFAPAQAVAFSDTDNCAKVVSAASPLPVTVTNAGSGGGAVTLADGADVAMGAKGDTAASSDSGAFSLIALTKRLLGKLPASLGQKTAANSLPVVLPSDMGTIAVSNTDGVLDGAIQTSSVTSAAVVLSLDTLGYAAGSFQVSSIGSGNTITFEQSNDGTNWTVLSVNVMTGPWASYSNTLAAIGFCAFAVNSRFVRARVSTYGSGTVTITSCLKRAKGAAENAVTAVLGTGGATIGSIAAYAGYIESTTALAANAALPSPASRGSSANPSASCFNARAFADQAGTLAIEQTINSGGTWETVASTAVAAGVAAHLRVPLTGVTNSATQYRVRYTNGPTAQTLFRLSSSFTAA